MSPAPMARAVVAKARDAGRVALTMDWRNMVGMLWFFGMVMGIGDGYELR